MKEITIKNSNKQRAAAELAGYIKSLEAGLEAGKEYKITIKEKKKRRSLEANAYAWALIDKLASQLHESKTAIYKGYIREIGGNSEIYRLKSDAADIICEAWQQNGLGWISEKFKSIYAGYTNVILYYGSSAYDSEQMSRLIDLIVQDCKALGIETKRPEEIKKILKEWG